MNYPLLNSCFYFNSVKKIVIITATIFFFLAASSCKDNVVETEKEILKDPREMVWTADTIKNPIPNTYQTLMMTMYASSPSNVYIAGHTDSRAQIWHYNGTNWDYIDYVDQLGPYNVIGLFGLSEKSIWVYGYLGYSVIGGSIKKPCVLQYNGNVWKLHALEGFGRIIRVGGDKENNLWAVGDSGIVFRYNGTVWQRDYVNVNAPTGSEYLLNGVIVMNGLTYLTAAIYDIDKSRYINYFIKGNVGNWTIVDSMYIENPSSQVKFGNRGLYISKDGELFSFGDFGVWKYNGTSWDYEIDLSYSFISVYSLKKDYTIAVGEFGLVYFYDSSTWTRLENFYRPVGGLNINDVWTDGKEIILLANSTDNWPMKTLIYKGN